MFTEKNIYFKGAESGKALLYLMSINDLSSYFYDSRNK
jgi:hypothetical protein